MGTSQRSLPEDGRVHLIGIGGAGMSALAQVLLERGREVSGSDLRGGSSTARLQAMGADVRIGHAEEHVAGAAIVVASTAIPEGNPEVAAARAQGIPVLRRAELLAALIEGHQGMLVSGTHGKTTTTSMITVALQAAGRDPSFAIGGQLHEAGTSAHHGTGQLFVAEADESDGSFLVFEPDCAVVTNVELDHPDYYADLEAVHRAFAEFLDRRRPGAPALVCTDDDGARALLADAAGPVITYGQGEDAQVRIRDVSLGQEGSAFSLSDGGEDLGRFALGLPGLHNVVNAAAAVVACRWAGADLEGVRQGLAAFIGTQRRFHRLGEAREVMVIDDYAHHPTELAATVEAARQARPEGRIVAVFQPHRYSRTAALGRELGAALGAADAAVIADVYSAGERPVAGVTGALVAEGAEGAGVPTTFVPGGEDLVEAVLGLVRPGDLVLTLGAGDITEVGPVLLERLRDAGGGRG